MNLEAATERRFAHEADGTLHGTALVVMERESHWPAAFHGDLDLVARCQEDDEREEFLLRRTVSRVHAIERTGGRIRRAVLSCNDDMTSTTLESRALIARALLSSIVRVDGGNLLLLTRKSSPLRLAILALADSLATALIGTSACVLTRFVG